MPLNFSRLMREKRLSKKLSQADLADIIGYSISNVKVFEARGGVPLLPVARKIAKALDFSLDQDFDFTKTRAESYERMGTDPRRRAKSVWAKPIEHQTDTVKLTRGQE